MKKLFFCLVLLSPNLYAEYLDADLNLECTVDYLKTTKANNKIVERDSSKRKASITIKESIPELRPHTMGKIEVSGKDLAGGFFMENGCEITSSEIKCMENNQIDSKLSIDRYSGFIDYTGIYRQTSGSYKMSIETEVRGSCSKSSKKF